MHAHDAISLLIFALGAFTIPLLAGRIGIPAAVGEIIFGIIAGPHVFGLIEPNSFTAFLAEFGFVFLMFLVGLELDFSRIEREGVKGFFRAIFVNFAIFGLSLGSTLLLGLPIYLFLVFGAMSVGVVLVTLSELNLTKSNLGQTLIFFGSLGEFVTIVLLTGFALYYKYGLSYTLAREMGKLGVIFAVAYAVLVIFRTLIWWYPHRFARVVTARDPSEIGVRAGMATMLVFVALAVLMGVESILGAFVAGALFSFVFREKAVLETKMSSIGFGFFVPIFFIWVGTEFNLPAVQKLEVIPLLLIFFVGSLVIKSTSVLILVRHGFTVGETIAAGLLLSAPLTLLVVVAQLGLEASVIDDTTSGAIVLLAIVTSIVLPWGFRLIVNLRQGARHHPETTYVSK